ncbi:MAG: glycoside hydrolase family 3 C-terminal domain-containing protein [Bacteroidales bacterium]|nr:glycoside hydrolase family 3 C-terminal domain-containing protein [Candidatus Cryptobacteroides aphodequi]
MKHLKRILVASILPLAAVACKEEVPEPSIIEKDAQIEQSIEAKIATMTLEEKVGQMVQINVTQFANADFEASGAKLDELIGKYKIGSFLNVYNAVTPERMAETITAIQERSMDKIGIPAIYGLDQIHGSTYLTGGTLFPQEINLGATFNVRFATELGKSIAYESRSALIPWSFSPVMDLMRNPCWSRCYESYGEDPYLQSKMVTAQVKAMQGSDPNHIDAAHVAVSLKHYLGYGAPASGKDRTPAYITESDLRDKFFAPFKAGIEAGAASVMVNSGSINGVPVHANHELITVWLKEQLHWDGMVITDWADINNLFIRDKVAKDRKDAIRIGINAGIDMIMDPLDPTVTEDLVQLVNEGKIEMARIDDAVARVLRLKYRLGLFANPTWQIEKAYPEFGGEMLAQKSLEAAVESEILLKNDGILPLKEGTKILLCGPNANSVRTLNGGWSYTWQGTDDKKYVGKYNTIYKALKNKFGAENVVYVPGVKYTGKENSIADWNKDEVVNYYTLEMAADTCDVIIACVGENTYAETPGNIDDLSLSANQQKMLALLTKLDKPVILVLNEGRPRVLGPVTEQVNAIVDILLPGNYGGDALAELLSGDQNFSGHLPFTYPKYVNSLGTYDHKVSATSVDAQSGEDRNLNAQWNFGDGLSYTTFAYSHLKANRKHFTSEVELKITVIVSNNGSVEGKDAVLLFAKDEIAEQIIPDAKRLRGFYKVNLKAAEKKRITFRIPAKELAYVGVDGKWRIEEGDYTFMVADQSFTVHCDETRVWECPNQNDPLPEVE